MDSVTLEEFSTVDLNNSFYIHRDLETDLQHQQPPDLPEIKPITPPKSIHSLEVLYFFCDIDLVQTPHILHTTHINGISKCQIFYH